MEAGKNINNSLAEKLSDPKTVETLTHLLDRLSQLHDTGVIDSLLQSAQVINFMRDGLTDTIVNKNATILSDLVEIAAEAASPEVLETVRELKNIHKAGKLKNLFEVTDTISFMFNSTTEKMMERNASVITELYNIADESADPAISEAVRELKNLQKTGNLKTLTDASYMLAFLSNSVTDSMIQRIAGFMAAFVEEVSTPMVQDIIKSMTTCVSRTIQEFTVQPAQPGIRNVIKALRDPEVQKGFLFMAALSKNMHQCMIENYSGSYDTDQKT